MHRSVTEQLLVKIKTDMKLGNSKDKLAYNDMKYIPNLSEVSHN